MKRFAIEHIGITTSDPVAAAAWYRDVLGFEILHLSEGTRTTNVFLRASNGTILEFWEQTGLNAVSDRLTDPLELHVALKSDHPADDAAYLVAHGATPFADPPVTKSGDKTVALRDPWGNCIQLARRGAGSFFGK